MWLGVATLPPKLMETRSPPVAYIIRREVSKQPFNKVRKQKSLENLTAKELAAIVKQAVILHGHKYKRNPLISHIDSSNAINDMGTCAPPMHCVNGIVTAIIKMICPFLPAIRSSSDQLTQLLSSGRAPEAAVLSRRCASFLATDVAARFASQSR